MTTITIPTSTQYYNLYTLSSIATGSSLVVQNNTSSPLFVVQQASQPTGEVGTVVEVGESILAHGNADTIWIKGNAGPVIVQSMLAQNAAEFSLVDLPHDVWTSPEEKFRRLRVDQGQTGLFEGREFRMVRKLVIVAGTPKVYRFTSAVDFILFEQNLGTSVGDIEFYAWRDNQGTPSGVWTAIPVAPIGKNISSQYRKYAGVRYASQVSIASGGDFTPTNAEVYVDYDRAKTSGATAQQLSVQGGNDSVRYLAAGTYYLKFSSQSGTSEGRVALAWEERLIA